MSKRLVYGTAGLGDPNYGIKSHDSRDSVTDIFKFLKNKIDHIDTSRKYKDSEYLIGNMSNLLNFNFLADTKFSIDAFSNFDSNYIYESIQTLLNT